MFDNFLRVIIVDHLVGLPFFGWIIFRAYDVWR